ncbi:glutathione-dependent formaldehyde-activating enzyme [Xylaria palmicola]|nr:glutathione-dependent formaldehyde-activating enzyme [Xylaria palmicola]
MAEPQAPLKTYRGNCHCAAFVYEITLPEIKQVSECNCSVCYKKAALWAFPAPADVKFVKGDPSALANYNFGKGQFTHKFCPTCGVSLMVVGHLSPPKEGEDKLPENGVNVRTLQHGQVDIAKVARKVFDGDALPPAYVAPKFTGTEPPAEIEGGQLYTGSCHCGAVTFAVKSKPINKDLEGVVECNCSICGKYGAPWAYPLHAEISIQGRENLGEYFFGQRISGKKFCKTCGVPLFSEQPRLDDERVARLSEESRAWYERGQAVKAVNLRAVNGLNVKGVNTIQMDGYNIIKPGYVEP